MKSISLTFCLLIITHLITAQQQNNENTLPKTMFSVEGGYHYSSLNKKNGVELRAHVWFLQKNSIGPEFHLYAPSSQRKYFDYQIDFNFRRILVDMHPLTFEFLIGPGFRSTRDILNEKSEFIGFEEEQNRYWIFDGINLGFGVNYRWGSHSIYGMPRINHKNALIQISLGYKLHFDIAFADLFNKKYKLRKKKRKS
jgi:hypothetical protein